MNNPIPECIQKVACRVPMIQPQDHLRVIPNLNRMKLLAISQSLRTFFQLQEHEVGIETFQKLLPFSQLASVQTTHKEPAFENKFHI
jgi:hypothetical protein